MRFLDGEVISIRAASKTQNRRIKPGILIFLYGDIPSLVLSVEKTNYTLYNFRDEWCLRYLSPLGKVGLYHWSVDTRRK